MTAPKIYGSFIRKLPVSGKSKSWLIRKWKWIIPLIVLILIGFILPMFLNGKNTIDSSVIKQLCEMHPSCDIGSPCSVEEVSGDWICATTLVCQCPLQYKPSCYNIGRMSGSSGGKCKMECLEGEGMTTGGNAGCPNNTFCCLGRTQRQTLCESEGGEWNQFSNGCVDSCGYQRNPEEIFCTQAFTYGCECGPDKCWEENKCVGNLK